jgi:hypothetical protein
MIPFYTAYEMCCGTKPFDKVQMLEFIQHAPARELEEFIVLGRDNFGTSGAFNREWLELAKTSLAVRIGEDAMASANKIVQQVTAQTDALVTESRKLTVLTEKLTAQTEVLISESRQVRFLTWGLLILTAVLLLVEILKEIHATKDVAIPNAVATVTNK